ncbi:hypothetical protein [Mesorhizobium silamurunense]|uniref:hypothetical protein n=1 Tax=Mesorhizobium silamurunense TaxID=499528 RepID=UPI0017873149|nr:hypothetical protein [Mesorhizobium silamurunense]
MPRIRVIDLETDDDAIVEIGYTDLVATGTDLLGDPTLWDVEEGLSFLVNPGRPISPDSSGIHNIVDEDVAGAGSWAEAAELVFRDNLASDIVAFAAHSVEHEQKMIEPVWTEGKPWVCTYKGAVRLWPEAPSHSNNALRYFRRPAGLDRRLAQPIHRAKPDSYITAFTLRDLLNEAPLTDLAKWTGEPALLPRCKIGDFRNGGKGTPWSEVDDSMLYWIIRKMSDDPTRENEVHTARHLLEQREIDQRLEYERADFDRQLSANGMAESQPTASNPLVDQPNQEPLPL